MTLRRLLFCLIPLVGLSAAPALADSDSTTLAGRPPPHLLFVIAACDPNVVAIGGTTSCTASVSDTSDHGIASWSWSDGGAGGSFAPSASVQNPTYTAPTSIPGSELTVTLTVSATCDGPEPISSSDSIPLSVVHTLTVAADCSPSTVPSAGTTTCTATYEDVGHGIASWSWDDGGAGGAFSPSASVQNPTYTAPANTSGANILVYLTVSATCDGPSPLSSSDETTLTVEPTLLHTLTISASRTPTTVPSGGTTSCSATYDDSMGHGIASWDWGDRGAGGVFSPSSSVQNPTYTAPANPTDSDLTITLVLHATCDGPISVSSTDETTLTVQPLGHALTVTAACNPGTVSSGGATDCTATYDDSEGHGVASWSWNDGDAGGTFSPSAAAQSPAYTAPENIGDTALLVTLTVTATCDAAADPQSDSGSVVLTVNPTGMFDDIPPDYWACAEVEACFNAGIVSGYDIGYCPTWPVSRDQMAVFISRAVADGDANVPDGPAAATFNDVPTDHWAFKYVEYCVANDIVQGYDPVTYAPSVVLGRDAMAVFISRAVAGGDDNVPIGPVLPTFNDVPAGYWAYDHIEYCADQGIVQGYDPVTYGPSITVSRDQMAVFISRAFDLL